MKVSKLLMAASSIAALFGLNACEIQSYGGDAVYKPNVDKELKLSDQKPWCVDTVAYKIQDKLCL